MPSALQSVELFDNIFKAMEADTRSALQRRLGRDFTFKAGPPGSSTDMHSCKSPDQSVLISSFSDLYGRDPKETLGLTVSIPYFLEASPDGLIEKLATSVRDIAHNPERIDDMSDASVSFTFNSPAIDDCLIDPYTVQIRKSGDSGAYLPPGMHTKGSIQVKVTIAPPRSDFSHSLEKTFAHIRPRLDWEPFNALDRYAQQHILPTQTR